MTITAITNGGFETAGAEPGSAQGWDVVTKASVEEYAEFETSTDDVPFEGFESGWQNDPYYTELVSPVSAEFGPVPVQEQEDFERDWDIDAWGDELLAPVSASFDSGTPEGHEDFEEEWDSNESFWFRLTDEGFRILSVAPGSFTVTLNHIEVVFNATESDTVDTVASGLATLIDALPFVDATFVGSGTVELGAAGSQDFSIEHPQTTEGNDAVVLADDSSSRVAASDFDSGSPEPHEDFEEEWRDNHNYKFAFSGGDLTAAVFDTTPEAYEDFEEEWTLTMETIP